MLKKLFTHFVFLAFGCFSSSVFAKLNFALTCIGNGQTMVLVAEHERDGESVLEGVNGLLSATLTTTKPTFNRSELSLASEDEKQFFYAEYTDWANLNNDRDIFFFLDRDTLKLTKYSKFPKRYGKTKLDATYSCQLSPDADETNAKVESLFKQKKEDKDAERQKQLKKNKV